MRLRWVAVAIFALSSTLNFLDRNLLAALAPVIKTEFSLSNADYGDMVFAFSMAYAITAPLAGWFIDRVGLGLGSSISVAAWSLAGIATGLTTGFQGLFAARTALGVAEAAGIPGTGKASAIYLEPGERAMGGAVSQAGLTLGGLAAPLLAEFCRARYGWRSAFLLAGALGFVWIPIWWMVWRRIPRRPESRVDKKVAIADLLRDTRYRLLLASNILLMAIYSLWVNWTTVFLVSVHKLPQQQANENFAWIPPIFATAGGLFGGWLSLRWSSGRRGVVGGRRAAFLLGAVLCLSTAAVPFLPSASWATAAICLSFFACVLASANLYALPIDLFGPGCAAFSVAGLTCVYGLLQGVFSSVVGRVIDRHGFGPVCLVAAVMPLLAYLVLRPATRES